jgi:hypothetical protein
LQLVETPESGDHLPAHLIAVTAALNDLQIGAPGRGLAAEPIRRTAISIAASLLAALSTMALAAKRAPERTSRSCVI